MLSEHKITEIYFIIDEFNKEFSKTIAAHSLNKKAAPKKRNRKFLISDSEVMTILVLFHALGYKNLKHFYLFHVCKHMNNEFPNLVSYNRFVELQKKAVVPMAISRWRGNVVGTIARICNPCPHRNSSNTNKKATRNWVAFVFILHQLYFRTLVILYRGM